MTSGVRLLEEFHPEEFHIVHRRDLGLTAFIAIDDTRLGPATGGIRWRAYPTPEQGMRDVLRLATAMTHKNAFAESISAAQTVVLRAPASRARRRCPGVG